VPFKHQTGDRALVGIDHQLLILEQIKAGPRDPRHLVVEKRSRSRAVSCRIVSLGYELAELVSDAPVAIGTLLIVHRHLGNFEFQISNFEFDPHQTPNPDERREGG
jgi:hypothetical protein